MSHRTARATGTAAALAAAVTIAGLVIAPSADATPAVRPPGRDATFDPTPSVAAGSWLTSQLQGGLLPSQFPGFADYGLSIDAAFALAATDQRPTTVTAIRDAVAAGIDNYASDYSYDAPADPADPMGPQDTYAGHSSNATAKAAAMAQATGGDPKAFGGRDLITELEGYVAASGVDQGRLSDQPTKNGAAYPAGDFANTLGQAFASTALFLSESTRAADATSYLLKQQCPAGWFRLGLPDPAATNQSCDPATDQANTDVTAIAVVQLQQQRETPSVAAAIAKANGWLAKNQGKDGSFGSEAPTTAGNANSTGLAAWALGVSGRTALAAKAAVWLRLRQLVGIAACQPFASADRGAVAYDSAAVTAATGHPVDAASADQFRRATAQALPGLAYAPRGILSSGRVASQVFFVRPGSINRIDIEGPPPGSPLCGYVGVHAKRGVLTHVGADSKATVAVPSPRQAGLYRLKVATQFGSFTYRIQVLTRKTIGFAFGRARVPVGDKQVVRVRGLARGELVRVSYRGKIVARGRANQAGRAVLRFGVLNKPGSFPVTVTGRFAELRKNTKTFRVTR